MRMRKICATTDDSVCYTKCADGRIAAYTLRAHLTKMREAGPGTHQRRSRRSWGQVCVYKRRMHWLAQELHIGWAWVTLGGKTCTKGGRACSDRHILLPHCTGQRHWTHSSLADGLHLALMACGRRVDWLSLALVATTAMQYLRWWSICGVDCCVFNECSSRAGGLSFVLVAMQLLLL
jgi:hypothetical protein